jgi:cytochrome c-type biogenesis protein CcmE
VNEAVTATQATKPPRAKWIAGISLVGAAIVGLAAWAILSPGALAYYKTPSEIPSLGDNAFGKTLRIGGRVQKGTLEHDGTVVHFTISDTKNDVPIVFTGDVPDTLKEGTDAIAEGTLDRDGTLHATRVQAKCSSKFVPKDRPGDLGQDAPRGAPASG